jgi:hypothetical protein
MSAHHPTDPRRGGTPLVDAAVRAARIAWRIGASRVSKVPARLLTINPQGATLESYARPADGKDIWLGLEALPLEWVRADVVSVTASWGLFHYRLMFREACPVGLLELAMGTAPNRSIQETHARPRALLEASVARVADRSLWPGRS